MSFFKKLDFRVRHDGRTPPKLEGGLASGRGLEKVSGQAYNWEVQGTKQKPMKANNKKY